MGNVGYGTQSRLPLVMTGFGGKSIVFGLLVGSLWASGGAVMAADRLKDSSSLPAAERAPFAVMAQATNTAPYARHDCAITAEGLALVIPVLANDWDADGDALKVVAVTQPQSGQANVNIDGTVTFVAATPGLRSFIYDASDGRGGTASATAWMFVNPADLALDAPVLSRLTDELEDVLRSCAAAVALDSVRLTGDEISVVPPKPGQWVRVEVTPGQQIELQGGEFVSATYAVVERGLLVITEDGRMVILSDFVEAAESDAPPTLAVAGGPPVSSDKLMASLQPIGIEPGAAPEPAAGAEHGGIFPIFGWLLSRIAQLGTPAEAQAANPEASAADNQGALLAQILAQIDIAKESQILELASKYVRDVHPLLDKVTELEGQGAGSPADVALTTAWLNQARLAEHAARLRWALAVDKHQDNFGTRLDAASFPDWHDPLPAQLDEIKRAVPQQYQADIRRYWRTMRSASEARSLYKDQLEALLSTRDMYAQHFDVGQRSLGDVLFVYQFLFEAQVKDIDNLATLASSEAHLLGATNRLEADYIQRPGWP